MNENDAAAIDNPEDAVALLQAIYRNPQVALPVRMRAAIEAAPYERPKLAVTAVSSLSGQDFARMLERAITPSQAPMKQIELKPNETVAGVEWTGRPGARPAGPHNHLPLRPRASDPLGLREGRELDMDFAAEEGAPQGEGAVRATQADMSSVQTVRRISCWHDGHW